MSAVTTWFEVKVRVRQSGKRYITRKLHVEAKDGKKARERCRRYGEPITSHKLELNPSNIENLMNELKNTQPQKVSPAIAMDEMIWARRNKRRDNMYRDKPE